MARQPAPPPTRAPRLKDVADAAGVHVSTASRALSERTTGLVSPDTLERVRAAAIGLGYRVNGMARALKTRRSLTVGMLVPDITNPFFPPAVRGADDALTAAGYSLILANTDNDRARAAREVRVMLEGRVDGLLLAMARREDPLVDELLALGMPVVLVNRTIDHGGVPAVVPDDHLGERLAVDHLHGLGHRRIGFLGGPLFTSNGARRLESFEQSMRRLGLDHSARVDATAFNEAAGYEGGVELLDAHPSLTAVLASNDLIALGLLDAAAERGLTCPRDLSVVGFNDMAFAGRFRPPLTTIRVPQYEVGRRGAELLLAQIDDPRRHVETVLMAPELVVRGSTAAPRPAPARGPRSRRPAVGAGTSAG